MSFISYDTLNKVCMFFLCITLPVVRIEFTVVILKFGIEDFTDPGLATKDPADLTSLSL